VAGGCCIHRWQLEHGHRQHGASRGGGIVNGGSLTLKSSIVSANSAGTADGGIFNGGNLRLMDQQGQWQ
jgi:hypothetical protein